MSFQELGHLFFPIWFFGCLFALVINARDWRMFGLTAFYFTFAITIFQLRFDGKAQEYGWKWYVLVSVVQLLVIAMTYVTQARASSAVRKCGLGIMGVCGLYLPFYALHHPLPRGGYFIGVNSFQAIQVLALIGFSPVWTPIWKSIKAVSVRIRSKPWLRIASGRI